MKVPFVPSLLVEVRKRMGDAIFEVFHQAIIEAVEKAQAVPRRSVENSTQGTQTAKSEDQSEPESKPELELKSEPESEPEPNQSPQEENNPPVWGSTPEDVLGHQGTLIIDATVADLNIQNRFCE